MAWGNTQYAVFVTQVTVHAGETMPRSIFDVVELTPQKSDLVFRMSCHENSQTFLALPSFKRQFHFGAEVGSAGAAASAVCSFVFRQLNSDRGTIEVSLTSC